MTLPAALLPTGVNAAATAGSNDYTPMLPFELVEATEHHGPYITTAFGTTVCDFYAMSKPGWPSTASGGPSKPVPFTDADENAAFMVRAANSYHDMLAALRLAEGRLALLLRVFPRDHKFSDHPTATRCVLDMVSAAIVKAEGRKQGGAA